MYRSLNIVRVIKSRRLRWSGDVARMEEDRSAFKVLTGIPTGKGSLGGLGVDGKTISEWGLNYVSVGGIGLIWLRIGIIGEP